ncbi:unnamed protein product [Paramecium primaurelia]|uniref:Importin subunit alpha n=1 Tax=Paramecium primaurelia TaxID=5886 RepID=A0A8S1LKJ4_PARPR|nr:unnamed protein product [Paramecium primaurelia]
MSDFKKTLNSSKKQQDFQLLKLIPDSLPDEIKQALKSSVENLTNQEADSEKFEEYVYKVNSDDIITSFIGLNRCRKLLSNPQIAAPTEQMIELFFQTRVIIKIFDIAKNTNIPLLKYEALWIICNIGIGTQKQIQTIVDNDGINILFQALESEYVEIIELGVWALANMAGENLIFRDMLLQQGVLKLFINLANKCRGNQSETNDWGTKNLTILKTLVWAFSNLAKRRKTQEKIFYKDLVYILCQIIVETEDEEILNDACWGLSYLSHEDSIMHIIIQEQITQKLVVLLQKENHSIVIPALRILGNILTGNEEQTNVVLNCGVLQVFQNLLQNKKRTLRQEVCWSLSNIAAGSSGQVKQIIRDDQLLNSIFLLLNNETSNVIEQISFIFSNCIFSAELEDIDYLVMQHGLIQKMSLLLDMNEKIVIGVTLEGIYKILKRFQNDPRLEQYKKLIVDSKIMDKAANQLKYSSKEISFKASKVFEIFNS